MLSRKIKKLILSQYLSIMTRNEKTLSQIYAEITIAINNIKPQLTEKEIKKHLQVIKEYKDIFGIIAIPDIYNYKEIKRMNIEIMDNIKIASNGTRLSSLAKLKSMIKKEPEFLEQFNF